MKYIIAIVVATLLIGAMFAFEAAMSAQIVVWETARADLQPIQILLVKVTFAIAQYWYVFATLILVVCLGGAAMTPATQPRH